MKTKEDEIFQYTPYILFKKVIFWVKNRCYFQKKLAPSVSKRAVLLKKIGAPLLVGSPFSISDHDRIFRTHFFGKVYGKFPKLGKSWEILCF